MISESCPFKECDGVLIDLPSIHKKLCIGCGSYFKWELKEGQKSVTLHNYIKGRNDYGIPEIPSNRVNLASENAKMRSTIEKLKAVNAQLESSLNTLQKKYKG